MVNQRNGFTYMANITVLTAALIVFILIDDAILQFRLLLLLVLSLGFCTSSFFICTIKEPRLAETALKLEREYKLKTMG